jgi:hypothetical protein
MLSEKAVARNLCDSIRRVNKTPRFDAPRWTSQEYAGLMIGLRIVGVENNYL